MKRSSIFTIIFLILMVIILGSCGLNEEESAILGLWGVDMTSEDSSADPGINIYYDFQENGKVIMSVVTALLGAYGNPLVPTHFDYKVKDDYISMTGLYGLMTMEYLIESGPYNDELVIKIMEVDIKLLPDDFTSELSTGVSITLRRIIDYSAKSLYEKALMEVSEDE